MQETGYEIVRDVFGVDELECVREAVLAESVNRTRAGTRHLLRVPLVASLVEDRRLVAIATHLLGVQPQVFRATLFRKSASTNWGVRWHQDRSLPVVERIDTPGWGPWSLKAGVQFAQAPADALAKVVALRVHLNDSTAANGPLRVLSGSHRLGVLSEEKITELVARTPAVECVVRRGGALAMRPLVVHSSPKAVEGQPRCVIPVQYCAS